MASADQIKALVRAYMEGDEAQFHSVAMQLAAHEARLGHGKVAQELRELIDEAKRRQGRPQIRPTPLAQPRGELSELLSVSYPKLRFSDMILAEDTSDRLQRLIKEHRQAAKLRAHGLSSRRKLLLIGPPGTGKTMTASVLAGELALPLFVVRLDVMMTRYMGETAAKLRLVFDTVRQTRGVYLFDEFDSIGSQRGLLNEVGEIRRVLNSFLHLIEQDGSDSLLIAATNHKEILDRALFRRFDDVIEYRLPETSEIISILKARLTGFGKADINWETLSEAALTLSYADITRACEEAIKEAILRDRDKVTTGDVTRFLQERQAVHQ